MLDAISLAEYRIDCLKRELYDMVVEVSSNMDSVVLDMIYDDVEWYIDRIDMYSMYISIND